MKKITSFVTLLLAVVCANAQSFFVKAGVGCGISTNSTDIYPYHSFHGKDIFSKSAQLNVGFTRGRMQLETGIGYASTIVRYSMGSKLFTVCLFAPQGYITPWYTPVKYNHLIVPVVVSYIANKDKKVSFYPGVGIEGVYNFKENNSQVSDFTPTYNDRSIAVILKFDIQYALNRHWGIWSGITYHNAITSLIPDGAYMNQAYDHTILFTGGMRYNICRPAK